MQGESFLLPVSSVLSSGNDDPIFFQFIPTIASTSEGANYEDVGSDIIGRAEPFSMYKNGSARELTIAAQFAAVDELYDEYWVQRQVHRIKALTKPIYDRATVFTEQGKFFAPPLVIFSMGARFINVPVVVKQVTENIPEEAMVTTGDLLPQVVELEIQIKTNYPYGFVPGYLNYIQQFPNDPFTRIAPENMSAGANTATNADVQQVLVDSAIPFQPTYLTTRGQRIRVEE
jgi:hypothetical protein